MVGRKILDKLYTALATHEPFMRRKMPVPAEEDSADTEAASSGP